MQMNKALLANLEQLRKVRPAQTAAVNSSHMHACL
jgi:hypothetical protein